MSKLTQLINWSIDVQKEFEGKYKKEHTDRLRKHIIATKVELAACVDKLEVLRDKLGGTDINTMQGYQEAKRIIDDVLEVLQ